MSYKQISPLPVQQGGTNTSVLSNTNGTIYFDGTSVATVNPGTSGHVLTSNGSGSAPTYQSIDPSGTNIISFVDGDSGTAVVPVARRIKIIGGSGVSTSGSGDTLTITSTGGSGIATLTATTGSATGGSVSITGTNSNIVTSASGSAFSIALANSPSVSGSITAGTGLVATTGGLTISAGTVTISPFTTTGALVSDASGVITDANANTAGFVLMSNGSGSVPTFQSITSVGAVTSVAGNSGSAVPSSGVLTISGSGPIGTSGSGSTLSLTTTAANTIVTGSGTATASGNSFTMSGGTGITTSASGATVTVATSALLTANGDSGSASVSSNALSFVGGSGITTSASGSTITIAASGGASGIFPFTNVTGATQSMAVNTGYVSNDGASLVTFTLPSTASVGAIVCVQGSGSGLFTVAQNSGQTIHFNAVASTTGVGGSVNSTSQYDSIYLMCITADTDWAVNQSVGNFNVI